MKVLLNNINMKTKTKTKTLFNNKTGGRKMSEFKEYEGNSEETAKEWNDRWDLNFSKFADKWSETSLEKKQEIMLKIGKKLKKEDKLKSLFNRS